MLTYMYSNALVNATTTRGQAKREVKGLQAGAALRPDLQIVYPGQHVLTDVAVVHPGAQARENPENSTTTAKKMAGAKRTKYAAIASTTPSSSPS
jgi:hypothetical protein